MDCKTIIPFDKYLVNYIRDFVKNYYGGTIWRFEAREKAVQDF